MNTMTANEEPHSFSLADLAILESLADSAYIAKKYRILSACALPRANVKTVTLYSGCPSATVIRHLKLFKGAGLITRLPCTDKRMRMLAVTHEGAKLLLPLVGWYRDR